MRENIAKRFKAIVFIVAILIVAIASLEYVISKVSFPEAFFKEYEYQRVHSLELSRDATYPNPELLINWITANASSYERVTTKILPPFNPISYPTPLRVDWFSYENHADRSQNAIWKRQMSDENYEAVMELLRRLFEALSQKGLTYTLQYGTLLGSARHFDMVPWDDDVDVTVDFENMELVKEAILATLDLSFTVIENQMIKVFFKSSPERPNRQSKYPYVDIFFHYTTNFDVELTRWGPSYHVPRSIYYPLKLRPFGKYWLPVPLQPYQVLDYTHVKNGARQCKSNNFDHVDERQLKEYVVSCLELFGQHLFTEKMCVNILKHEICFEKLRISSQKTVFVFDYSNHQYAVTVYRNT